MDGVNGRASEILRLFRGQEEARMEVIHPLLGDPILRNLVVAWSLTPVEFTEPEQDPPTEEARRWEWLWNGTRFDKEALAAVLQIEVIRLDPMLQRAIAFRLIYPDGTANSYAIKFIRTEVAKGVGARKKPKAEA